MSQFPSLPLFTDAFIADTLHLDMEQTGAYLTLLMIAWRLPACALPDDDKMLAKWVRMSVRSWLKLKPTVMAFWVLENGYFFQKRLKKEREYASRRAAIARENGRLGGRPKPIKTGTSSNPAGSSWDTQTESKTKAPNPNPNPSKKERERGALAVETYLAEDWILPPDWRAWAAKRSAAHAHMIDLEAEKFRAFWVGKEVMRRNWRAAWEKWWLDTVGRPPSRTPLRAITGGSRTVHNTEESLPDYTARMIREGKFKPMPIAAKE